MQKFEAKHYLAFAGTFVLIVLLILAPRIPQAQNETNTTNREQKILDAVELVEKGNNPLEGILKLREVLEEDSTNLDALWHLGIFSLESQQFENAIKRFGQLARHDKGNPPVYPEVWIYLGQANKTVGKMDIARQCFEKYLSVATDSASIKSVETMIQQLIMN